MALEIRRVDYFYCTVHDQPGEAYRLLSHLAAEEIDLLAFNAIPAGPSTIQLVLFPASIERLARAAEQSDMVLAGPHHALLIQGDDHLGALVDIHGKLYDAGVNVSASSGVTDGKGNLGYVVYVRPQDFEEAARVLGV